MRTVAHSAAPPDPAPYAAAEAAFAEAKAYLCSCEARQMSESDLERELHRRGQELMRKLLQGHLDQRSPGEAAGPVEGADEVERSERRVHERHLETTFGTVQVERLGYARPGHDSLHPLDAALNLPPERYSLEVRRRVAEAAASRSFDEALFDLSRSTGAQVPKRQAEQLVVRAAEDFDAFYEARRAQEGEPPPEGSVVVLTFDGKGVVLHREDLREATRKAAEKRRQQRGQLSRFKRLKPGEKKHSKRMATVAAVYTTAPFVRSPEEFLESLMPRPPGAKPRVVRPRPVAKRVWASLEREPVEVVAEATLEAERQDPEHVKRWVALVDGAETQLDLVEASAAAYGVDVTVILDIIHVVEYVWKAAHVFHSEGSPELECWVGTRVRSILEGKARKVAAAMRRAATVAGLSSDTRKPVDTCADYLLKYAPYLHYDRYLAAGYPIATGVIEGACRYLVRDRMELTGARWRLVGAEAVLKLRALRASRDFDAYWDFHEAREYQRNHAQRYADGTAPPVSEPHPPPSPPRLRRVKWLLPCRSQKAPWAADEEEPHPFGFAETQLVSFADLYAGKLVAALDRQHPRDLFDVRDLLANEGVDDTLRTAFVVYMLSHNRPMAEVLAPTRKDISQEFERGFSGMTQVPVTLDDLVEAREQLVCELVGNMSRAHKDLLVSFEAGEPDWSLIDVPQAAGLPAVRWRQENLNKLDRDRRKALLDDLKAALP